MQTSGAMRREKAKVRLRSMGIASLHPSLYQHDLLRCERSARNGPGPGGRPDRAADRWIVTHRSIVS